MKIREFIRKEISIDVYDDICEALAVAFEGPQGLTEAGEQKFAEVLDYEIEILPPPAGYGIGCAFVKVDDEKDSVWRRRLRKAKEFFDSAAGLCAWDDYEKWFDSSTGSTAATMSADKEVLI